MTNAVLRFVLFLFLVLAAPAVPKAQDFSLAHGKDALMILYSREGPELDSIAAHLLAGDIQRVTGNQPKIVTDITEARGHVIVIGSIESGLIKNFIDKKSSLYQRLQGKWECFALTIKEKPKAAISKALVIAGSDARGTAYGVFTLSEKIGISPWWWWADVPVKHQPQFSLHQPDTVSASPSVKFRGIFINDEDWGLRPWASTTFEPEVSNIGPKTYAKVFELLLRLKANLVWPAMHPGTKPFYSVPGNSEMAARFSIVIGS
ncbi:MAG TPA: glycosyl hydrolase 115 family protein, partial [Flavisolibacter sp.]|nr:glycosyl hydrolase 115 family protein [Flavisolibacter sp.]